MVEVEPFLEPLPARQKFRDRTSLHVGLFFLTLLTTTGVGAGHYAAFLSDFAAGPVGMSTGQLLIRGFWYSGTILLILGAHELGHYLACRYYQVDATLPFFIPAPRQPRWPPT